VEKIITLMRSAGNDLTISAVTIILLGTSCWLWIHAIEIPKELAVSDVTVLMYWFKNYRDERPQKPNAAPSPP